MSAQFIARRIAGPDHAVATVKTDGCRIYRTEVCVECPWRLDSPLGAFPAEAYRLSARTAYDMSTHTFACHMAGTNKPQICAGFLIAQGRHNLAVRLAMAAGDFDPASLRRAVPTFDTYREMAEANGVDEDDPVLTPCRDDGQMGV
jgi:hypothetical protein